MDKADEKHHLSKEISSSAAYIFVLGVQNCAGSLQQTSDRGLQCSPLHQTQSVFQHVLKKTIMYMEKVGAYSYCIFIY